MDKMTKRGFVMTGGGAKGLYEAGVIHAFHLCGMEFDVITGSSIGAINSVFYAEYQLRKKQQLSEEEIERDPLGAVEKMDPLVRSFLHAWWKMPTFKIIDDSETGPLGLLEQDLEKFDLSLPQITRLAWWYTDPQKGATDFVGVFPDIARLGSELLERFGKGKELYELWRQKRERGYSLPEVALRAYLDRFGIQHALVPDDAADNLRTVFTQSTPPLQREHLQGRTPAEEGEALPVVEAVRTMKDYADVGIEVRLTRTNYRTGRLEVSTYYSAKDFVDFMLRHAFRWPGEGARAVSLGSERLQVIGNPGAVNAALASGRFPGVFSPMGIDKIYEFGERDDDDNKLLQGLLANWLNDEQLKEALFAAFAGPGTLDKRYEWWRESDGLCRVFPKAADYYVDGGTIDNTPANSAIDGIKEWAKRDDISMRDLRLDLFTIFLHPAPDPGHVELDPSPALYQVVKRTLEVQSAAKLASGAVNLHTINTFGKRGADLNKMAIDLAEGLQDLNDNLADDMQDILTKEQLEALNTAVNNRVQQHVKDAAGRPKDKKHDVTQNLDRVQELLQEHSRDKLPLHVEPIEIYPDKMPMDTLQFTERLGYRKENGICMMTVGCYNTLWTLRVHLEKKKKTDEMPLEQNPNLDKLEKRALGLARNWMGIENWPKEREEIADLQDKWQCRRRSCVFFEGYCARGGSGK